MIVTSVHYILKLIVIYNNQF